MKTWRGPNRNPSRSPVPRAASRNRSSAGRAAGSGARRADAGCPSPRCHGAGRRCRRVPRPRRAGGCSSSSWREPASSSVSRASARLTRCRDGWISRIGVEPGGPDRSTVRRVRGRDLGVGSDDGDAAPAEPVGRSSTSRAAAASPPSVGSPGRRPARVARRRCSRRSTGTVDAGRGRRGRGRASRGAAASRPSPAARPRRATGRRGRPATSTAAVPALELRGRRVAREAVAARPTVIRRPPRPRTRLHCHHRPARADGGPTRRALAPPCRRRSCRVGRARDPTPRCSGPRDHRTRS